MTPDTRPAVVGAVYALLSTTCRYPLLFPSGSRSRVGHRCRRRRVTTASTAPAAPAGPLSDLLPGGTLEDPVRRRIAMVAVLAVGLGLAVYQGTTTTTSSAAALWIVTGVGVPLALAALRPRGGLVLVLAALALLGPIAMRTSDLAAQSGFTQEAAHDGGVLVTEAAAHDLLAGRNPYATSYADDLPEAWAELQVVPGESTPNPVVDHLPYLPGAVLAAVPGALLDDATGVGGDPRWVMALLIGAALVVLARRPEEVWARAAAMFALGSSFAVIYAAWGTNDAAAAALVVLAMAGARRHPVAAGLALALAVSYKAPLAAGLVPWAVWEARQRGLRGLARWWSLPTALAVTCVPFLAWSPDAFRSDTVDFWLGRGADAFPASGLGLAYRFPGLMDGPAGAVITVGLALAALALAIALVRTIDHEAVLPVAAAVVLLGLLIPARTFQPNYLALVTGLLAPVWLLAGRAVAVADDDAAIDAVLTDPAPDEIAARQGAGGY